MPQQPTLELVFQGHGADQRSIGQWPLLTLEAGVEKVTNVSLTESFGTINLVLTGLPDHSVNLLLNGEHQPLSRLGSAYLYRIPLDYDLEFHRISVIAKPRLSLTLDVSAEHLHDLKSAPTGLPTSLPKWSRVQFSKELARLLPFFAASQQRGVQVDELSRGLAFGKEANLAQAILQTCTRLATSLAYATPVDMLPDFCIPAAGDLDREALLNLLKEDYRRASKSPTGPIVVAGVRYTTALNVRLHTQGTRPDLAEVATLIEMCQHALVRSSCPAAALMVLADAYSEADQYSTRASVDDRQVQSFLNRQMHSAFGATIQGLCRQLLALVSDQIQRDHKSQGIHWLQQSIRDFDVFQAATFACCATALGFSQAEIFASRRTGVLKKDGVALGDTNIPGGLAYFEDHVTGWRRSSSQPSDYRPDSFVFLNEKYPVLIDAKFRMASSYQALASSDSLKDIQAYLDEFSLSGAVVVVPRIPNSALCDENGLGIIQGKDSSGRDRLIAVVEMQDSLDAATVARMKKAVELVAATAFA